MTIAWRLRRGFDSALRHVCLDQAVDNARLARNCLAHAGATASSELLKRNHGLTVIQNRICIQAPDVRKLYHSLKDRATKLAITEQPLDRNAQRPK